MPAQLWDGSPLPSAPGKPLCAHPQTSSSCCAAAQSKEEELDGHSQPLARVLTAGDCRPTV
ncbi:MAG: hypothetical protein ACTHK7_11265, partial [Aureliella sp.]